MRMNMMMIILQIVTTIKMIITYFRVYYEKKILTPVALLLLIRHQL